MMAGGTWMPREQWDALVRGESCPLCATIASQEISDDYGHTVADLSMGRLRLCANQSIPGYCVFISRIHVCEPYELSSRQRVAFFEELMQVGQALERAFQAVKLNFEILGNAVPHLHCHIKPRYYDDPAPGYPINPDDRLVLLTAAEYQERVAAIRREVRWT